MISLLVSFQHLCESFFFLNSALNCEHCFAHLHCFDSFSFVKGKIKWSIKRILLFPCCSRENFHWWGISQEEVNLRFYRGRQSRESLWGLYESWRRLDMSAIWKGGVILWNYLFFRTQRPRGSPNHYECFFGTQGSGKVQQIVILK